jgi:hypothetical protein
VQLIRCFRGILTIIAFATITTLCCAQDKPAAPDPATPSNPAPQPSPAAQPPADAPQNPPTPAAAPAQPTQETPLSSVPAQEPAQPAQPAQNSHAPSADQPSSKDRLFYTLPNFLTLENAGQVPPMSATEKFKVVTRSSFDPVQFAWYGLLAGISQAQNSEPGYGQGMQGYGKRYGAAFGDGVIEGYMVGAVMPSIFRQDPRYFQSGKGGFWRRTGYAVSRIFVTRGDSGNSQFNVSEIFGSALSSGISTYAYHPRADKTLSNAATVWGTQVSYDTLAVVVKEFWPDIRRKLHKDKN